MQFSMGSFFNSNAPSGCDGFASSSSRQLVDVTQTQLVSTNDKHMTENLIWG